MVKVLVVDDEKVIREGASKVISECIHNADITQCDGPKEALEKAKAENQSKKVIAKLEKDYQKWEAKRAPREGFVIRVDNDPKAEAWKVKTNAHLNREAIQHDAEEIDIEETA